MSLGHFTSDEFPHICTWHELEPDIYNPKHQKQLLRGKKLYHCPSIDCRKAIWLKHQVGTILGMQEILLHQLALSLDSQIEDLRIKNWDEHRLRTWEHLPEEDEEAQ